MKKHFRWLAVLLAIVLVTAACGDDDSSSESADSNDSASTEEEAVEQTQGGDLTFHMITHSDDGPFWSVVKRGMEAACADVGVNCVWMPGNNDRHPCGHQSRLPDERKSMHQLDQIYIGCARGKPVSYTHLTLPTILLV